MDLVVNDGVHHVGHFIKRYMSLRPDDVAQIDAATGEEETKGALLARSTRLAGSLRRLGLQPGDVLALGGKNHLDVHVPFYAAAFNGLPMAGVDPLYKYEEIRDLFKITKPKIAFCEPESYDTFVEAAKNLGLKTLVITFRGGAYSMQKFMEDYQDPTPEDKFEIATFDVQKIYCWLVSTSGTTGVPKVAAIRHIEILQSLQFFLGKPKDKELRTGLNLSSMQWISACYNALTLPVYHAKVQTSLPTTAEHVADIINKYKPRLTITTPTLLSRVLKVDCDFTCFDMIAAGGSKVHSEVEAELRSRMREDAILVQAYGQTESVGVVISPTKDSPLGSLGKLSPNFQAKLVDPDSGKVITEPMVKGELWVKGLRIQEYYNDPKATEAAFTPDGWFKTGDILYKDQNDYYYFVDRLKMLIKYRNYQIVPPEIEEVIYEHPGVSDVAVTSIENPDDGERVVACVVRKPGSKVTAQEIKDLVASKLSVHKQLYGGVLFMDKLPLTSTDKVARNKLKQIVKTAVME